MTLRNINERAGGAAVAAQVESIQICDVETDSLREQTVLFPEMQTPTAERHPDRRNDSQQDELTNKFSAAIPGTDGEEPTTFNRCSGPLLP